MTEPRRPGSAGGSDAGGPEIDLGTPERPWIVSSAQGVGSLPDGAWYAIVPDTAGEPRPALVFQKPLAPASDEA
jgi:hypothetical protein